MNRTEDSLEPEIQKGEKAIAFSPSENISLTSLADLATFAYGSWQPVEPNMVPEDRGCT